MRRAVVSALGGLLNAFYALCGIRGRRDVVLFLSRQSDSVSDDFRLIAEEFAQLGGWEPVFRVKMLHKGVLGKLGYAASALGDARMLARCKICFLEGYSPVVSMLRLKGDDLGSATVNRLAPTEPLVMQLWHASGALKKFGYQVLDTPEGRSSEYAEMLHMHRNYSWIVVSGEGAVEGFSEALGYPASRVVPLGRASFDLLLEPDEDARNRVFAAYPQLKGSEKPVVVFAPTLSRVQGAVSLGPLREALSRDGRSEAFEFIWSDHPVTVEESGRSLAVSTRDLLRVADFLVTDCSSIVYEARVLGVPFAFYTSDSGESPDSPALMVDLGQRCPQLCFDSPDGLFGLLEPDSYPWDQNDDFIGDALSAVRPGCAGRIARFACERIAGGDAR